MSAFYLKHPKETDLALFAGGEAGPFARWRIERHLETCPQCEQAVADFFHLADELSVLGDTPDLDWNAMATRIHARLAATAPDPRLAIPPWTWQFGAAVACALVVTAVMQVAPKKDQVYSPAAEEAIAEKSVVAQSVAPADEHTAANEAAPRPSAPERQLSRADSVESESIAEAKKESAEPALNLLADQARTGNSFSTDAAAPPPPPPAKMIAMGGAAGEADAIALAKERRARSNAPLGASAPAPVGVTESFRAEPASFSQISFSVEPLPAAGEAVRVGADGWISVRAVQADGSMTITDVYEPQ